jgi:hypothetical protein
MKKAITILVILVAALGCSNKKKGATASTRQAGGAAATTAISNQIGSQSWGAIGSDTTYFEEFQSVMKVWVESEMDPNLLGAVNPDMSDTDNSGTGARFWGRIILTGSKLIDSMNMPRTTINTSSTVLGVGIWDEYVDQTDSSGSTILPFVMFFNSSSTVRSGWVEGNQFELVFEDTFRRVTLRGDFDADYAEGEIKVDNKRIYSGESLGVDQSTATAFFSVPTCGFFQCAK